LNTFHKAENFARNLTFYPLCAEAAGHTWRSARFWTLEEEEIADMDEVFLEPFEGDNSDGYDISNTEEGESFKLNRTILQVNTVKRE
jgi:hypothetical protein